MKSQFTHPTEFKTQVMVQEETRKGPWTEHEDLQLMHVVRYFGERRWDFIAKVSGSGVARDTTLKHESNNR